MLGINTKDKLAEIFGIINIIGLMLILILALSFQFYLKELPCPLCLLQRIGFIGIMISLSLNLQFDYKASHTGFVILFAIFTAFVALRQILLHIVPGTGAYGAEIFGLHLYTWSFVISIAIIIYNALILIGDFKPYLPDKLGHMWQKLNRALLFFISAIILINMVTVFLECGFEFCPDNPTKYIELSK